MNVQSLRVQIIANVSHHGATLTALRTQSLDIQDLIDAGLFVDEQIA